MYVHHIDEDKAIMLSTVEIIKKFNYPFEWQKAERLVYCDLLEHLLLHIKIQEFPHPKKWLGHDVGIEGSLNFIIPELNDIYSGISYKQIWKQKVIESVIDRKDEYFLLLDKIRQLGISYEDFSKVKSLPFNSHIWNENYNNELLEEIKNKIWKKATN